MNVVRTMVLAAVVSMATACGSDVRGGNADGGGADAACPPGLVRCGESGCMATECDSDAGVGESDAGERDAGVGESDAGIGDSGAGLGDGGGTDASCPPGLVHCGESGCVDLDEDVAHCGDCDLSCSTLNVENPACTGGVCSGACVEGYADCNEDLRADGCETNLTTSAEDCGACGAACEADEKCEQRECVPDCSEEFTACGVSCVDVDSDPDQCGGCAEVCSDDNVAERTCSDGECDGQCAEGYADCNEDLRADGCEANLASDPDHCGACGTVCSDDNVAERTCAEGTCGGACAEGFGDCNGDLRADGCETSLEGNVNHCLACDNECPEPPHMSAFCGPNGCDAMCMPGHGDCNGDRDDGCETTPESDPDHCGACGAACSGHNMATRTCSEGLCDGLCAEAFGDCNGDLRADGCEVNIAGNPDHCGACGAACSDNHVTARTCSEGACGGACAEGFGDCNGDLRADGCETSLQGNVSHCLACGNVCPEPSHMSAFCGPAGCDATCMSGFEDCNGNLADGCETSPESDPDHCGACGDACSDNHMAERTCAGGACGGTCAAGFDDCNGDLRADGCETDIAGNPDQCGACGTACSDNHMTERTCADGACGGTCEGNFDDCNGDLRTDGCETDVAGNPNHCGACGDACSNNHMAERTCADGACGGTCAANFGDCNGDLRADGCETDLRGDVDNCGGCGVVCGDGERCVQSMCAKVVFTTSTKHNGARGGLAAVDAICQARADAAGLPGEFKAWASAPGAPANQRLDTSWTGRYVRVDNVVVANGWSGWASSSHLAPLNKTETGGIPPTFSGNRYVWTGTTTNGSTASAHCGGWTQSNSGGIYGSSAGTGNGWTNATSGGGGLYCAQALPFYCIQQ